MELQGPIFKGLEDFQGIFFLELVGFSRICFLEIVRNTLAGTHEILGAEMRILRSIFCTMLRATIADF